MKSNYRQDFFAGAFSGILVWVVITIADAVDELLLDVDTLLGAVIFFAMPIAMLIFYIINYLKNRPSFKKLLVWFASYYTVCLILWWYIYSAAEYDKYIIKQGVRSDWLNLNGIEYIFYGYSVVAAFSVLCLAFHIALIIKRLIKRGFINKKGSGS